MRIVNIHEAKTNLSKLVERAVQDGEAFVIARAGKPLVKVAPLQIAERPPRRVGFLEGRFKAVDNVKDLGRDEIAALFDGEA
jgi:prevent-host-death family protein